MEKFWYLLYKGWCQLALPVVFVHKFVIRLLWDMYWYKYVVPRKHGRPYIKTGFLVRVNEAWHYTKWGD